ncbi:unnamed protein product, partial [Candidula unifasciata]
LVGSKEDSKLGFVVNAVTAMAVALQDMHQDLCPDSEGLCPAMDPNVSFKSHSGEEIHFDQAGDPSAKYNILNYQPKVKADGNTTYDYVTIGTWETGVLKLDINNIYWPQGGPASKGELKGIVKSVCAEPCNWDQVQVKVNSVLCCWICTDCAENAIVDNNTLCKECQLGTWPNANKTDCQEIPVDSIHWSDTQAVVSITVGSLAVVKASTRELSYIILVGICLAFSSNFILVSKPAKEVCYLTRILPGLSFSLMYGALVTRTNRIARILEGSKRIMTKKPKFMSATAQVVISLIIIGLEGAVITGMLLYQPADSRLDYSTPRKVRLICDTSTLGIVVPLGFDLVLIILCTIYAVKTRNLPENFNEAKFIGFAMYATCVIWLGFFPIYFAGENKEITFSMSMSLSAAVALVLLFIPKVYVIVWVPEKNTRGAFTTSKDVRCHIGVVPMTSGHSFDIKLVMQHTTQSMDPTPYMNHGVLSNHSDSRSTSFLNRKTKANCRTDSLSGTTTVSCCPEAENLLAEEPASLSDAEVIRQNLAGDFPLKRRPVTLRPGSPAEKEKHRISNADRVGDFDELLEMKMLHVPGRFGRLADVRKSLSSTCVSGCPSVVSVQCQTTDDLIGGVLPPLRRRCVVTNKSKLKRSTVTEDVTDPKTYFRNDAKIHSHGHKRDIATSEVYESSSDCVHSSEISKPASHSCQIDDNKDTFRLLQTAREEPTHLDTFFENHFHQHNSKQNTYEPYCQNDIDSYAGKNSPYVSPLVLTANIQRINEPIECSASNFIDKQNPCDNYTSQKHNIQCETLSRHLPLTSLENNALPLDEDASEPIQRPHSKMSSASITHQNSCSSSTVSMVASSSFTIPAFLSSTDSDASQRTFNDSLQSLDLQQNNHGSQQKLHSYQEGKEFTDLHTNGNSELHGNKIIDSTSKTSNLSFEDSDNVADDVLDFHKYLQGHGVQLELSTVQSSDL